MSEYLDSPPADEAALQEALAALLQAQGWRLATAESCTGGALALRITGRAGCSAYYAGGVVAYANAVKTTCLGVTEALLVRHGAVSEAVAMAMAVGALAALDAEVAVSTTGVAGPSGGTPEKPVGLVYVGLALRGRPAEARKLLLAGSRQEIQMTASQMALKMIYKMLLREINNR